MMHDALRGDVLSGLRAGQDAGAEERAEVEAALNEHVEWFRERVADNQALDLSGEIPYEVNQEGKKSVIRLFLKNALDEPEAMSVDLPESSGASTEIDKIPVALNNNLSEMEETVWTKISGNLLKQLAQRNRQ